MSSGNYQFLASILNKLRLTDCFYCKSNCYTPWGFINPKGTGAIFHFVVKGGSFVITDSGESTYLEEGDLVLLPKGDDHSLKSDLGAKIIPFDTLDLIETSEISTKMILGSRSEDSDQSILICGGLTFHPEWHPIFEILPSMVTLKKGDGSNSSLEHIIKLMENEVYGVLPGSEVVITRLCELLVIAAIRNWAIVEKNSSFGWIQALKDRNIGKALNKIHEKPSESWSVASLAKEAVLSRTVFAERFAKMLGVTPMQYLLSLRMNLAGDMLRKGGEHIIEEIAFETGYSSEVSFRRAFKRFWGKAPGAFRSSPEAYKSFGVRSG